MCEARTNSESFPESERPLADPTEEILRLRAEVAGLRREQQALAAQQTLLAEFVTIARSQPGNRAIEDFCVGFWIGWRRSPMPTKAASFSSTSTVTSRPRF
ncbi:MAG: hypothetical protein HC910_13325 [Spirulinaceae cyanobacterium SM2_1_0]|nr:hypothetical protein [Spirulinaceae cyanobacterium SM2_1_0]